MPSVHTVVVGAGHGGLALSRCLTDRGVDHVVLDRGEIGERWRSARWDSFRLLTPNWLSRLPGWSYSGSDPDGFMTGAEFVDYLCGYARSFDAPVRPHTTVTDIERSGTGFAVRTVADGVADTWTARAVVLATGYHGDPRIPALATDLAPHVTQVGSAEYRSPGATPPGGVLVVGASASGLQIADELAQAGRAVVLAVGRHSRLPRCYRGRDIVGWLDRLGVLDRPVTGPVTSEPSLQLAGSPEARRLDLGVARASGVRLAGRLVSLDGTKATFAADLAETVGAAQARLDDLLGQIESVVDGAGGWPPADPPPPIQLPATPSTLDLHRAGIATVIWATGFRPRYPWLRVEVLDEEGGLRHRRGVTDVPGLYAIGLRFQSRRSSTFIDGARHDAEYLADHLVAADHHTSSI